jgi:hypothetical protein
VVYAAPTSTGAQYLFIRALLGLGVAGIAVGGLTGTIKLEWTVATSMTVTAVGGIAILLFFYLVNPPSPPNPNPVPDSTSESKTQK